MARRLVSKFIARLSSTATGEVRAVSDVSAIRDVAAVQDKVRSIRSIAC